jgi:hypothetical protein
MGGRDWVYGGLACLGLVSGELEVLRVARLQLTVHQSSSFFRRADEKSTIF